MGQVSPAGPPKGGGPTNLVDVEAQWHERHPQAALLRRPARLGAHVQRLHRQLRDREGRAFVPDDATALSSFYRERQTLHLHCLCWNKKWICLPSFLKNLNASFVGHMLPLGTEVGTPFSGKSTYNVLQSLRGLPSPRGWPADLCSRGRRPRPAPAALLKICSTRNLNPPSNTKRLVQITAELRSSSDSTIWAVLTLEVTSRLISKP